MIFRRKKPKRLYIPTKSHWYTRPRTRKRTVPTRKLFKGGLWSPFARFFKNAFHMILGVLALLLLIGALFMSSYLSITKVDVIRESFNIDSAAIENQLNSFLGQNILFVSKSQVAQVVHDNFPEFETVQVKKILPRTLKIELASYPLVANLRAYYTLPEAELPLPDIHLDDADIRLPNEPYIPPLEDKTVRQKVFLLEEAPDPAGAVETSRLSDGASAKADGASPAEAIEQKFLLNRIGQAIFDKEEDLELMTITLHGLTQPIEDRQIVIEKEDMDYLLDSIRYFNNLFENGVTGVEYKTVAREIHFQTAKNGPVIWLTTEKDYKEQIDKLKTIYEPAGLNAEDIAYIDLRIKEKVIYCPKKSRCNQ